MCLTPVWPVQSFCRVGLSGEPQVALPVEPHSQRIPVSDKEPLTEIKLGAMDQQRTFQVFLNHPLTLLSYGSVCVYECQNLIQAVHTHNACMAVVGATWKRKKAPKLIETHQNCIIVNKFNDWQQENTEFQMAFKSEYQYFGFVVLRKKGSPRPLDLAPGLMIQMLFSPSVSSWGQASCSLLNMAWQRSTNTLLPLIDAPSLHIDIL